MAFRGMKAHAACLRTRRLRYPVPPHCHARPHTSTSVSIWDFKSRYRYYTQLGENYKRVTESQKGGAANRLHLLQRRVYLGCEVDYTAYFLFKSQK